jgi:hypothetical protein
VFFTGLIIHGVLKSGRTAGKNSFVVQDQIMCDSWSEEISMPEKLCPVDKKPCIKELCVIFNEESGLCSWAIIIPDKGRVPSKDSTRTDKTEKKGGYRAHLFD